MKTATFWITICTLSIFVWACGKANTNEESSNRTNLKIQAIAAYVSAPKVTVPRTVVESGNVIATLNLKSYNAKTGEVIFENPAEELQKVKNATDPMINISLGDQHLFSIKAFRPFAESAENAPILYYDHNGGGRGLLVEESKWYIWSGFPQGRVLGTNEDALSPALAVERKENFKKIEAGWNLFLEELEKEEKIINK